MTEEARAPEGETRPPTRIQVEADLFISYLTSDNLEQHFRSLVEKAKDSSLELLCSSEVYDDIATALRSQGVDTSQCSKFLADTKLIPHESVPLTPEVASKALELYSEFGGRRRLHYFDAFHVSTAKALNITFYTSDKYVIHNSERLGIKVVDIRSL
jgi:predicted nucleic acid-binding protein